MTPILAVRAVYARRKGPVKRKGVISRGCEANCALLLWANQAQKLPNTFNYNELQGTYANLGREGCQGPNSCN